MMRKQNFLKKKVEVRDGPRLFIYLELFLYYTVDNALAVAAAHCSHKFFLAADGIRECHTGFADTFACCAVLIAAACALELVFCSKFFSKLVFFRMIIMVVYFRSIPVGRIEFIAHINVRAISERMCMGDITAGLMYGCTVIFNGILMQIRVVQKEVEVNTVCQNFLTGCIVMFETEQNGEFRRLSVQLQL